MRASRTQLVFLLLFAGTFPASGIVIPSGITGVIPGADTNAADYLAPYGTVRNGVNLNGVVYITHGSIFCSGALISPTQVLTAAHCINPSTTLSPTVNFVDSTNNLVGIGVVAEAVDPNYMGSYASGSDLAIFTLATNAPSFATPYQLFLGGYTIGTAVTMAGFGYTGTGDTGATSFDGLRRVGENSYDIDGSYLGVAASMLVGDFDNGNAANNAIPGSGLGLPDEVDIAHGDSGGPSFYNGQLIGIHDIIDCQSPTPTSPCSVGPSVFASAGPNSYYGEFFGDTSVQANAAWIQGVLAPEPSTWVLMLPAGLLLGWVRRKSVSALVPTCLAHEGERMASALRQRSR